MHHMSLGSKVVYLMGLRLLYGLVHEHLISDVASHQNQLPAGADRQLG
jgi:hypothetical protein